MVWQEVYLGLGSNLGDRHQNIMAAVQFLQEDPDIIIHKIAPVYETAPQGVRGQPDFLNTVALLTVKLTPWQLLVRTQRTEEAMGRVVGTHGRPRFIDLDILLFGDLQLEEPTLTIPHPRLTSRAFVVVPLADLAPDYPLTEKFSAKELAEVLRREQRVVLFTSPAPKSF